MRKKLQTDMKCWKWSRERWVEAIFAKVKPETEKPRLKLQTRDEDEIPEDTYNKPEEDDEPDEPTEFDDENITEDNYRTTFEISSDSDEEAENISDFDGDE